MEVYGRVHSFESFGTLDGPGIRFVVFLQGCPLRCRYCHNPDSWATNGGPRISVTEIVQKIDSCRNFLRSGGVTLSGGEPLAQPEFSYALLTECRAKGFHTAIDTAGSLPLDQTGKVIDAANMLLLDIKALDNELCIRLTGSDNKNTLATLDYCEKTGKEVWIRHVLVPEWTMTSEHMEKLAGYLKKFNCVSRIDLLPFHRMADFKWHEMNMPTPLPGIKEPDQQQINSAKEIFSTVTGKYVS